MQDTATADWARRDRIGGWSTQRRNLAGACLAHLLHDGYTDQLYALLPIWQPEFGLSYAGLALVRALYSATAGGLQVPADRLAAKLSPRVALALATFIAAAGYLVMALPLGFAGLCIGLIIAGIGSSVQHPRASTLVTNSYGKAARDRSASTTSRATSERRPFRRSSRCFCPLSRGGRSSASWP
jgi:MFS family permease